MDRFLQDIEGALSGAKPVNTILTAYGGSLNESRLG